MHPTHRKVAIATAIVAVIATLAFVVPWSSIFQSINYSHSLPNSGDNVTVEQMDQLIANGEGKALADAGYMPIKFVDTSDAPYVGERLGDGLAVVWGWCPSTYTPEQCPKQFDAERPLVYTDTKFDAIDQANSNTAVGVIGVTAWTDSPGNIRLTCKTLADTSATQSFTVKQVVEDLGELVHDGKAHQSRPNGSSLPWMCRGYEQTLLLK